MRVTRKLALAEALGTDIANVEDYQKGQHNVPLFQAGDDIYAVVTQQQIRLVEGAFTLMDVPLRPGFDHNFYIYKRG